MDFRFKNSTGSVKVKGNLNFDNLTLDNQKDFYAVEYLNALYGVQFTNGLEIQFTKSIRESNANTKFMEMESEITNI